MSSTPVTSGTNTKHLRISKDMRVHDILTLLPYAGPLMAEYGLHCFTCSFNATESLEEGCKSHAMRDSTIDDLVNDLNVLLNERPDRPQTLTITEAAAHALKEILQQEGKAGWGLHVGLDSNGGFSMDFVEEGQRDDSIFFHASVPEVRLFASTATLEGIGGSTIDVRDGRFKLDMPEDRQSGCACKNSGVCGC